MSVVTLDNGSLTVADKGNKLYCVLQESRSDAFYYEVTCSNLTSIMNHQCNTGLRIVGTYNYTQVNLGNGGFYEPMYDTSRVFKKFITLPVTIMGVAINKKAKTIKFFANGVELITYSLTDELLTKGKCYVNNYGGGEITANFGATPFKYPIPVGYTSYDGNQSNTKKYFLKDSEGYKRLSPIVKSENAIPQMTSATTPSGEVTCSSQYSDTIHAGWTAFARDKSNLQQRSWWTNPATTGWLQYKFASVRTIVKYTIRSHITHPEQFSPEQWTFEGSKDGINYVILDTRVNEVNWGIWEKREYTFENNNSYTYYRINVSKGSSGSNGTIAIEEMEMFEKDVESVELVSTEMPTEEQFKAKGMSDIPSYNQISDFNDLVTYTTDNPSKSFVKFKPKAKTVLSSGDIMLTRKRLKKVSLTGSDNTRVVFSKDKGETWYNTHEISSSEQSNKIPIISATSTSPAYSTYTVDKVINGITNDNTDYWIIQGTTPFQSGETGHILKLDLGASYNVNKFSIHTYAYGSEITNNGYRGGVKDFKLYGSNDGVTRELLYTGTNPPKTSDTPIMFRTDYTLTTNKMYPYYIFSFSNSYWTAPTSVFMNEVELYGTGVQRATPTLISDISTQGLTPTQLTAITPEEWKTFMGDSGTLRFAYYLPDETANTDKLELTVDFIGE